MYHGDIFYHGNRFGDMIQDVFERVSSKKHVAAAWKSKLDLLVVR